MTGAREVWADGCTAGAQGVWADESIYGYLLHEPYSIMNW